MLDVVEDHFEVLVVEGDSRSAESSYERLTPCDRFTIEFGTPEMLKSMFSSSIARLNLFTFDDAVSRCPGESNSSTVCVHLIPRASPFYREHS